MTDQTGKLTAITRKGDKYQAHYQHTHTERVHYTHPVYTGGESMIDGKILVSRAYKAVSTKEVERTETAVYDITAEEAKALFVQAQQGKHQLSRLGQAEWTMYVLE